MKILTTTKLYALNGDFYDICIIYHFLKSQSQALASGDSNHTILKMREKTL